MGTTTVNISATQVKELRDKTGAPMMNCKQALTEAKGDMEQAVVVLRKKGVSVAAKKATRTTSEGSVTSYIHAGGKIGVLVEVNCESDFVARTEDFKELVHDIAMHIAAADPQFEALLENPALRALFAPRMTTHGLSKVREYCLDLKRYTNADTIGQVTKPSFVTDNETDLGSTGQGQQLLDALTAPKQFRRFRKDEGAEGHCEGMAPTVFWAAAFDWLDSTLGAGATR